MIKRVAVAYEAGRDGFWLARWLRQRGIEAYVIHPSSVPVSREHRRAKTDRLDTELLKRAFLGWLRGEPDHCSMAAIPTLTEEDAKAAWPRARKSRRRTHTHHQQDKGSTGAPRHPKLQAYVAYASAAKPQGGGPILNRGAQAMSNIGLPPPRIVNCRKL
jgi:hypothetical protein